MSTNVTTNACRIAFASTVLASTALAQQQLDTRHLGAVEAASCAEVAWNRDLLAQYPRIDEGCQEVVISGGEKWARFEADLVRTDRDGFVTLALKDRWGRSMEELTLMPATAQRVLIDGREYRFSELARGQQLNLYFPEGMFAVGLEPGVPTEQLAEIAVESARRVAIVGSAAAAKSADRQAAADSVTESANTAGVRTTLARAAETERARETASWRATADAAAAARNDLRAQLNSALPTHESNRGLVSELSGAVFATGTAQIDASAREGLAKFSEVVAAYPTLRFHVEGHTDSTGRIAANNALSLQRAIAARDYLIGQGVPASSIDVAGLGESRPMADNSTSDGRARNRRVEIVISGGPLEAR